MNKALQNVAGVQQFIQGHPNAIVLFYRPGCPYCSYVLPLFDTVEQKLQNSMIAFLKVDIGSFATEFKAVFQFSTVPTFIYFKNGQERFRHGSNNMKLQIADIEANIEKYIV